MSTLEKISNIIDKTNEKIGHFIAWLTLVMVLVQFIVVILRYVYSIGFIQMQESIWYMHGIIFMLGAGYTLLKDGHVRVDVFYRDVTPRMRAIIDFWGGVLYLLPICILIFYYSFGLVVNSWKVFEGSTESDGIQAIFLYKTVIWVFAFLVFIQGTSMVIKAWLYITGQGTHYDDAHEDEFLSKEYLEGIRERENES
ncbi:MAG: TRAP transporter small permease subunit [Rhizobiales bacterium]|nr:TRAP transporter small permease subunit [Hyphomicrobiales bacterium]